MNKEMEELARDNWDYAETVFALIEFRERMERLDMDYSEFSMADINQEVSRLSQRADKLLDVVENPKASKQSFGQALSELTKTRKKLEELYYLKKEKKTF